MATKTAKAQPKTKPAKTAVTKFTVTQEYLDANPGLDLQVGDEIEIPEEKGFVYPLYDLWKLDVEAIQSDKDGEAKKVKLTAVKIERSNVKIEDNVAESINMQSHNSRRRYYKKGTIQNGHEEVITVK